MPRRWTKSVIITSRVVNFSGRWTKVPKPFTTTKAATVLWLAIWMTKKIVSEHVGAWSRYTLLLLATSCLLAAGYSLLSGLVAFFLVARCRVRDSSENPMRNAWFPRETRGSLAKRVVPLRDAWFPCETLGSLAKRLVPLRNACFACVRNGVAWIAADSPARGFGRERTYFFFLYIQGKTADHFVVSEHKWNLHTASCFANKFVRIHFFSTQKGFF